MLGFSRGGPRTILPLRNTPGKIRTSDLRIRSPLLYPTELPGQVMEILATSSGTAHVGGAGSLIIGSSRGRRSIGGWRRAGSSGRRRGGAGRLLDDRTARGDRDVAEQSLASFVGSLCGGAGNPLGERKGVEFGQRARASAERWSAAFDQSPAGRDFMGLEKPGRREEIKVVREPIPRHGVKFGLAVEPSFDPLGLAKASTVRAGSAPFEVPGLHLRKERRARLSKMRFTSGDQVAFELLARSLQHLEFALESFRVTIIPNEVGAALFALDHDGPWSGRSTADSPAGRASKEGRIHAAFSAFKAPGIEQAAIGVIEPTGGINPILGDRTTDFGGDRSASKASEPGDREAFEF